MKITNIIISFCIIVLIYSLFFVNNELNVPTNYSQTDGQSIIGIGALMVIYWATQLLLIFIFVLMTLILAFKKSFRTKFSFINIGLLIVGFLIGVILMA